MADVKTRAKRVKRRGHLCAVVLAAGRGTRMRSDTAKVLHPVCGVPLGAWPIEAALGAGVDSVVVVVGHHAEAVRDALVPRFPDTRLAFALQAEQRGTGHAVMCARAELAASGTDRVLILCGDVPCISTSTLRQLVRAASRADLAFVTFEPDSPGAYGRIVRDAKGKAERIVEAADATAAQRAIREVNAGIYCVDAALLEEALGGLTCDNAQGELYLTDLVSHAYGAGKSIATVTAPHSEVEGVNDRVDLSRAAARLRERVNTALMRSGVTIEDPRATYIEAGVVIGKDTTIGAGAHITGATRIGRGCVIGAYSVIDDSTIKAGAIVKPHTVIESAVLEPSAQAGPFARIRPNTVIGKGAAIGNFVEAKNSRLAAGVKAGHLSYLGDADIGAGTNIGAGTITCNYDGERKHRTLIQPGCFIGSNSSLVAPVKVGKGAYVGAGSTITKDVPPNALGVARGRQRNLEGWAERKVEKARQSAGERRGPAKTAPREGTEAAKRRGRRD